MALLNASLKTELQKASPRVFPVLEIAFSDGTKRYAKVPYCSTTNGYYQPKVISFGSFRRTVSDRTNNLESPQFTVAITDEDSDFRTRLGKGDRLFGTTATIKLASPAIAAANWFTLFSGILYEWNRRRGEMAYDLTLRYDDLPLLSPFPRITIDKYDWPNAAPDALGQYVPIAYGRHDGLLSGDNSTKDGAIPTYYVDTVNWRYVVCLGRAKEITRVYDDAVRVTTWATAYVTVNGRLYTVIDSTVDRGTSVVTCDILGYETVGDGTGTLMDEPTDQIKHLLVNFVYNEPPRVTSGGSLLWRADSEAPVSTGDWSTTKTFLAKLLPVGYKGSIYLTGQNTGIDVLNNWCQSHEVKAFWTNNGNIAIRPDDQTTTALYLDDPWLRWETDDIGDSFTPLYLSNNTTKRVTAQYSYVPARNRFGQTLECSEPSVATEVTESLEMPYGPNYF